MDQGADQVSSASDQVLISASDPDSKKRLCETLAPHFPDFTSSEVLPGLQLTHPKDFFGDSVYEHYVVRIWVTLPGEFKIQWAESFVDIMPALVRMNIKPDHLLYLYGTWHDHTNQRRRKAARKARYLVETAFILPSSRTVVLGTFDLWQAIPDRPHIAKLEAARIGDNCLGHLDRWQVFVAAALLRHSQCLSECSVPIQPRTFLFPPNRRPPILHYDDNARKTRCCLYKHIWHPRGSVQLDLLSKNKVPGRELLLTCQVFYSEGLDFLYGEHTQFVIKPFFGSFARAGYVYLGLYKHIAASLRDVSTKPARYPQARAPHQRASCLSSRVW